MADPSRRNAERDARLLQNVIAIESHLLECVDIVERGEEAFFGSDFIYRNAAYAALIQAGNAVKDLSELFRVAHPEVNWRELMRTRDKVGHIYGESVDWDTIWAAIVEHIPSDLAAVTQIRSGI
ncbi:HepT-like ribonuclease domain-containing protein [Microbacterium sp. A84]|uniref:HepT-like ribonuclease domain-containing protein n=1 Tax=Microbacterium sp. A84 TaxID=3450715 RepID=UPI003F426CA9